MKKKKKKNNREIESNRDRVEIKMRSNPTTENGMQFVLHA